MGVKVREVINTRQQVVAHNVGDRVGIEQLDVFRGGRVRTVFDISRRIDPPDNGTTADDYGGGTFVRTRRGAGTIVGVTSDGMHYTVRPDHPWTDERR